MSGEVTGYKYIPAWGSERPKIVFKGSNSQTITLTLTKRSEINKEFKGLFELFDKYSTTEDPDITPKELCEIKKEFLKTYTPTYKQNVVSINYYEGVPLIFDTYAADGTITSDEIAEIFETFQSWLEHPKKYDK